MFSSRFKKIVKHGLLGAVMVLSFLALPSLAQDTLQIAPVGEELGLAGNIDGADGLREIVIRVVRSILGFVGLIAVLVIMYGGYVWMTSAGNSDKVERAKTIIVNGLIGLAVIIASFAIVSLVVWFTSDEVVNVEPDSCVAGEIRACGSCGGTQTCGADGRYGICNAPALCVEDAPFSLMSYTPTGEDNPVNTTVKMRFKKDVEDVSTATVQGYFIVTQTDAGGVNSVVPGVVAFAVDSDGQPIKSRLVFTPNAVCSEDVAQKCFNPNTTVTVIISDSLSAEDGERLTCPVGGCTWTFGIGEGFDSDAPTVSIITPRGTAVPQSSDAKLRLRASDDFKLSSAWFEVAAGTILGSLPGYPRISADFLPSADSPRSIDATVRWNTSGLDLFSQHEITVKADDVAGRGPVFVKKLVTIVAPHCANDVQDGDETDIDCGGSCLECGAPRIISVEPSDAAPGDYIQIVGRYFGNVPGKVVFSGPDREFGTSDDVQGVVPVACSVDQTWTDTQIIIGVPSFVVDSDGDGANDVSYSFDTNILVEDSDGAVGDTAGWDTPPLFVNTAVKRPSICSLSVDSIRLCAEGDERNTEVTGVKFGGNPASPGRVLFGSFAGAVSAWQTALPNKNTAVAALPTIESGKVGVRVESPGVKYCVGGSDAWKACVNNTDCSSNVCESPKSNPLTLVAESCTPRPVVSSITPASGPERQVVTITGSNFGDSPRQVVFKKGTKEINATFDFTNQCSAVSYWRNNQIIARVPSDIDVGEYEVIVRTQPAPNLLQSDSAKFVVNNDPLTPALICALPDNGPTTIPVRLVGESFGESLGAVTFTNNQVSEIDNRDWNDGEVKTTVPGSASSGPVVLTNANGLTSNPIGFTVGSCSQRGCAAGTVCCGDGTCRATREECPVPPAKPLSSYRWRVTTGDPAPRVVEQAQCLVNLVQNWSFEDYDEITYAPVNWDITGIDAGVETGSGARGDNSLMVNNEGTLTQRIPVSVASSENLIVRLSVKGKSGEFVDVFMVDDSSFVYIVKQGLRIEVDDEWQQFTIMGAPTKNTSFSDLRIKLPLGVMVDDISVQSVSSATATTQSPSPYIGTRDACLNTALALRFTTLLGTTPASLGTMVLSECADVSCQNKTAVTISSLSPLGADGVIATPSTLKTDTWYEAQISNVRSNKGVAMLAPYVWKFKTGSENCAIAGASCSPRQHTLVSSSATVTATAGLQAMNCNILTCAPGDISWKKSGDDVTNFNGALGACSVPVVVKQPNPREGIDLIKPEITSDATAVVGMCAIEVEFASLRVAGVFPNCDKACVNSQPIIAFTAPLKTINHATYTKVVAPGTYLIEECSTPACTNAVNMGDDIFLVPEIYTESDLRGLNLPTDALQYAKLELLGDVELLPNKYYRVTILGGESGIRSIDNKTLEGGTFSWVFGTKDQSCGVDRVGVAPADVTVRSLGAKVRYSASPFSTGDDCAPGGQLLLSTDYNYAWSTVPTNVATITQNKLLPPAPKNDNFIDPIQYATAVGKNDECRQGDNACSTDITATESASTRAGSGNFTLQCGYVPAGSCVPKDDNLISNGDFENGITDSVVPGFYASIEGESVRNLVVSTGGAVGGAYLRSATIADCVSGCTAPYDREAWIELPNSLVSQTQLTVRLFARASGSTNPIPQVYVNTLDSNNSIISSPGYISFGGSLTSEWREYTINTQLPAQTKYIAITFHDYDIDGVYAALNVCSNNTDKMCSSSTECNAGLNLCGLGGEPNGTCSAGLCSNDSSLTCNTNEDCRLAVTTGGCCAVRPYVTDISYATYNEGTEKMCINTGFNIDFSALMEDGSLSDEVVLEWQDDGVGKVCDLSQQLADLGLLDRFIVFIKQLFGMVASAQAGSVWCGVQSSVASEVMYNDLTGLPSHTRVTLYPLQLLDKRLTYRIVVRGENLSDPSVGVRSLYGVVMGENKVQSLASGQPLTGGGVVVSIGERVCEIDHVTIDVAPELPQDIAIVSTPRQPRDLFQCIGDNCNCTANTIGTPGCRLTTLESTGVSEDIDPTTNGNQHRYSAKAVTAQGQPLSVFWSWNNLDPQEILQSTAPNITNPAIAVTTIKSDLVTRYGLAQVRATARTTNTPGISGVSNNVNVLFDRCANPWKIGPLHDEIDNFITTYCLDNGENGTADDLPHFGPNTAADLTRYPGPTGGPLAIRGEYILKHAQNSDAIALRVIENSLHLTPLQWYNEQSFEKGNPTIIEGGIDGYSAIVDGRTAYIAFGNTSASGELLYTNILVVSHSQNAGADTIEVFNRLLQNLTFNVNALTPGECRVAQKTVCTDGDASKIGNECQFSSECNSNPVPSPADGVCSVALQGKACLTDNDCSVGFMCTSEKAQISRDIDRFTKMLDVQGALLDYQYGTSCPQVTPGAPGDADCNGVINGRDVIRVQSLLNTNPAFCKGADFDLSGGNITIADVGAIQQFVRQKCARPTGRSSAFPPLNDGTFVEKMTTSVWPSWQQTFGRDLGVDLPTDPINLFSQCGGGGINNVLPHSPYTCWDPNSRTYASFEALDNGVKITGNATKLPDVPAGKVLPNGTNLGSHVFAYAAYDNGNNYALCTYFESGAVPSPAAVGQVSGTGQQNRVCVLSDTTKISNLPAVSPFESDLQDSPESFIPSNLREVSVVLYGGGAGNVDIQTTSTTTCTKGSLFSTKCTVFVSPSGTVILTPSGVTVAWDNCPQEGVSSGACQFKTISSQTVVSGRITGTAKLNLGPHIKNPTAWTPTGAVTYLVEVDGSPQNCGSSCDVEVGSRVTISAGLPADALFEGWSASSVCAGQGESCTFIMPSSETTTAMTIRQRKWYLQTEIVALGGVFGGTVTFNTPANSSLGCSNLTAGDNPGSACRTVKFYNYNEAVTLTAVSTTVAANDVHWEGCDNSSGYVCSVTMTRDKVVRVRFGTTTPQITLKKVGDDAARVSTVAVNPPNGETIECPEGCTEVKKRYPSGTKVTLRAVPSSRGQFTSWDGCTGTATADACEVVVGQTNQVVTATFNVPSGTIVLRRIPAAGQINVSPYLSGDYVCNSSIAGDCTIKVPLNTPISLTVTPNPGYSFSGVRESGSGTTVCGGGATCSIGQFTSSTTRTFNVSYIAESRILTVAKRDTNSDGATGTISSSPAGINCGATCSGSFGINSDVVLTAVASSGSVFNIWENCPSANANVCTVRMTEAKNVTAVFEKAKINVTVNFSNSSPADSAVDVKVGGVLVKTLVPSDNQATVNYGSNITLEPKTGTNISFLGWSAGCTGTGACQINNITTSTTRTATFVGVQKLSVKKHGTGIGSIDVHYFGEGLVGSHTFSSTSGEVVEFEVINGKQVVLKADYGSGVISTFMCPTVGGVYGTEIPSPPTGSAACSPVAVTGNLTAQVRFNTAPTFNDSSLTVGEDSTDNSFFIDFADSDYAVDSYTLIKTNSLNGIVSCEPHVPTFVPGLYRTPCKYTPSANFSGTDTFEYVYSDGNYNTGLTPGVNTAWNSVKKTVTITVSQVNDPPTISSVTCNTPTSGGFVSDCTGSKGVVDGQSMELLCMADDIDSNPATLLYEWIQTSADGLGVGVSNTSNPLISVPVRIDVPVAAVGVTSSSSLSNTGGGQTSNVSYTVDNRANAMVVTYFRLPTNPTNPASQDEWWPETVKWQSVTLRKMASSTYAGTVNLGVAIYYYGPDSSPSPLPKGSGILAVKNGVTNWASPGKHVVSISTFSGVAGANLANAINSQNANSTGGATLSLSLPGADPTSLLVGGAGMKNTTASTTLSIPWSNVVTGNGATDIRYGSFTHTGTSNVTIGSSGTTTNQITYALAMLELRKASLQDYVASYQCRVTDSGGLNVISPPAPGVNITRKKL